MAGCSGSPPTAGAKAAGSGACASGTKLTYEIQFGPRATQRDKLSEVTVEVLRDRLRHLPVEVTLISSHEVELCIGQGSAGLLPRIKKLIGMESGLELRVAIPCRTGKSPQAADDGGPGAVSPRFRKVHLRGESGTSCYYISTSPVLTESDVRWIAEGAGSTLTAHVDSQKIAELGKKVRGEQQTRVAVYVGDHLESVVVLERILSGQQLSIPLDSAQELKDTIQLLRCGNLPSVVSVKALRKESR